MTGLLPLLRTRCDVDYCCYLSNIFVTNFAGLPKIYHRIAELNYGPVQYEMVGVHISAPYVITNRKHWLKKPWSLRPG